MEVPRWSEEDFRVALEEVKRTGQAAEDSHIAPFEYGNSI